MSEALIQYDIIILGNTKTGKKTLRDFLASISPQESLQQGGSSRISMMKRKYQLNQDVTFSVRYWVNRGDFRTYSNFIKTIENVKGVVVLVDLSDRKSIQKIENYFISFQRRNLPIFLVGNKCDLDRQNYQFLAKNDQTNASLSPPTGLLPFLYDFFDVQI